MLYVQNTLIIGAVSARFVAPVCGINFYDIGESGACCRESVVTRISDNPYDAIKIPFGHFTLHEGTCSNDIEVKLLQPLKNWTGFQMLQHHQLFYKVLEE